MLSKKMEDALNAQINAEFWSAYLYLSMSSNFAALGNPGFANWFSVQFKEEQDHAMILIKYILSRGGKVTLAPIDKVQTEWSSPLAAFEDTLAHEKKVTSMINNLYALAEEEKDYATKSMLGWFIDEQVEEEETAQGYIDALKMIKDNGFGVWVSPTKTFAWGSNMNIANKGMLLLMANKLKPNADYVKYASYQRDYLLGRNAVGYCYVTGYGTRTPLHPHHRPSQVLEVAMPGMLVGGADSNLEDPYAKAVLLGKAPESRYADNAQSFSCNEVTIYWNSPMIYLMSGLGNTK